MDGAFSFSVEHQNWIFRDGHRTRELLAAGAGYRCEIGERINIEVDCAQPILRAGRSVPARRMVVETAVAHVHAIDEGYRSGNNPVQIMNGALLPIKRRVRKNRHRLAGLRC